MSSSVLLNRAAHIIELTANGTPADAALRETLARMEGLTPEDKRSLSRTVFIYFRWFAWLDQAESTQKRINAALELQRRFDADETAIKPEALAVRAVPEWVASEIDPLPPAWVRQLQRDPALWIRVQSGFAAAVPRALGSCRPADLSAYLPATTEPPTALRFTGDRDLFRTDEFRKGLFEIQDLASQLVSHACAPQPGETWWDACAGEGGKMLHLSDLMKGKGLIWASDRSARRITHLKKRASRAQAFNYRAVNWNGGPFLPTKTKFDGVLLDAPCSGLGTWQRNPHARWSTTPTDVRELAELQRQLLHHVAASLKPGGRLVYSVCTLTRSETTAVVEAFAAEHPEFEPVPVFAAAPAGSPVAGQSSVFLWPHELNANGMFLATWRRKQG